MLPSARPNAIPPRCAAARRRYGLIVAAIGLVGSAAWAVENGDEAVDSGWAVGTPAAAILDSSPSASEKRDILHRVREQSSVPLVRESGPKLLHPADRILRIAERPNVNDGWRASGLHVSPFMTSAPARSGPRPPFVAELPLTLNPPTTHAPAAHGSSPSSKASEVVIVDDTVPELNPPTGDADSSTAEELDCDGEAAASDDTEQADAAPAEEPGEVPTNEESVSDDPTAEETVTDGPAAESSAEDTATESQPEPDVSEEPTDVSDGNAATVPADPLPQLDNAPLPPLPRQMVNLRSRVRSVLKGYYRKPLNSREHDCWEVMHGMLSYGIHSRILQGSPRGESITAVGWLCYNKPCKGLTLMYVTPQRELRAKWGVGLQGHTGQLLAMLAQCKVSPDYPIHVGKNEFTIHDLIEAEKKTCYPKSELTFKLLAFQQYLDLNEEWVNDQGLDWDIPRLIREEIAQPIRGAACGGTHRLSALSLTVKARERRGEPLDGEYARAAEFVEKYERYAFRLQNRDGSLSTEWFRGRGDEDDKDRRIKTTGHILEWLCYSLDDEELRQPQTVRAVWYLANLMYSNYDHEWEVGPRSHAIHALLLYDERVFKPYDKAGEMANYRPAPSTANRSQRRTTSQR